MQNFCSRSCALYKHKAVLNTLQATKQINVACIDVPLFYLD